MPTSTNVANLKINTLTKAQYDAAVQGGVIGPNELSVITDLDESIQVTTLPTASAGELGKIYQFVGTTDASYTNGYFYQSVATGEEITDGECDVDIETFQGGNDDEDLPPPTFDLDFSVLESYLASRNKPQITSPIVNIIVEYGPQSTYVVWLNYNIDDDQGTNESVNVVTSGDAISDIVSGFATLGFTVDLTGFTWLGVVDMTLPTEDEYGWVQKDVQPEPVVPDPLPDQTGQSGKFLTTDGSSASWGIAYSYNSYSGTWGTATGSWAIGLGDSSTATGSYGVAIGSGAKADNSATVGIGQQAQATGQQSIAIGRTAKATARNAIQLGYSQTNADANTVKIGNDNGNYEILSADGTIPTARFTTDPVSDGTYVPTLTISSGVATRSWSAPSGGLPSQTGNAGKFLTTDGTDASWGDALVNAATNATSLSVLGSLSNYAGAVALGPSTIVYSHYGTAIGSSARATYKGTAIGYNAIADANFSTAIGYNAVANAQYAIQVGVGNNGSGHTNNDANTLKVGNANGNFEMMSADGTIPEARLADTTNAAQGQVLTLDSNNNAVWQTPSTAVTSTTATLVAANWSSNTQTLTVSGVTSSNVVIVSPQPLSSGDYATAGVLCTAQNTNSLTFTCTQTPSNAIDLSIVIIG